MDEHSESEGMLGRLGFDDFGACAECGKPLSFLRVLAHPGSCLCNRCEHTRIDADQQWPRAA